MTRSIDLNADLGEGCPWDEALLDRVTSACISCGAHAGDPETIGRTLQMARSKGVVVGAHPGFPDRTQFGRLDRENVSSVEAEMLVRKQVAALAIQAGQLGHVLQFIKPHGALYNQAQNNRAIASGVVESVLRMGLPVVGLPGCCVEQLARAAGMRFVPEGFIDRRYAPDGTLVPRSDPNPFVEDPKEMREQLLRLVELGVETICIHGDIPQSVAIADLARETFEKAGIAVRSFVGPPSATTALGPRSR